MKLNECYFAVSKRRKKSQVSLRPESKGETNYHTVKVNGRTIVDVNKRHKSITMHSYREKNCTCKQYEKTTTLDLNVDIAVDLHADPKVD